MSKINLMNTASFLGLATIALMADTETGHEPGPQRPDWIPNDDWKQLSPDERQFAIDNPQEFREMKGIEGTDETVSQDLAHALERQADEAALNLMEDASFQEEMREIIKAPETVKRGPGKMAVFIKNNYDFDEIAAWPEPFTEASDIEQAAPGSNLVARPDKYTYYDNDGNKQKGSFYGRMWDKLDEAMPFSPEGKSIAQMLEEVSRSAEKGDNVLAEYRGWGKVQLDARKQLLRNRKTNGTNALRKGVQIVRKMALIEEQFPKVQVQFIMDEVKDEAGNVVYYNPETNEERGIPPTEEVPENWIAREKLTSSTNMFTLRDAKNASKAKPIGVGTLLAMKLDVAKQKGGNYEAFVESTAKKPKKQEPKEGAKESAKDKYPLPTDPTELEQCLAMANQYLEDKKNYTKVQKWLANLGDEEVLTIGGLWEEIDNLYNKVKSRYESITEARGKVIHAKALVEQARQVASGKVG